jgi:exonuclease SbcC
LDEGFGTLDGKLVDTVMDVLGKLSKNFAVGLISHVDELKTRIENKILVSAATETHGSTIKTETYA